MGASSGIWPMIIGLLGLLSAFPVHGRGDTFQAEHAEDTDLEEAVEPTDDILDINLGLILPEAPEHSFLIEGDIIKTSPFRLFSSANPRWPKKRGIVRIPYVISYRYDKSSLKIIKEAFEDFARFTCIKFVPYSYQRDFISIAPLSGCFSSVGRIGGMQVVSLAPACLKKGKGVALHELMHVLGFWHEHSRADRDKYISISWNEILNGFEMNFMKSWNTNMLGDYDYSSVMHYGRNAFSMSGLPTIIPLSSPSVFLGQRWNLSNSDIARVNKLYKCSQAVAEPELSTGRVVKQKMMDFIPSEPQPCCNKSQVETSTAWSPHTMALAGETLGATMSSGWTLDGITATEAQTLKLWPFGTENHKESVAFKTSSKLEESTRFLAAPTEIPHQNQSKETETSKMVSTGQKTSVPPALQNPTSSAGEVRRQSPSYMGTSLPKEQIPRETRTRAALEAEFPLFFLTESPVLFSTAMVQGVTVRPSQTELVGMTEITPLKHTLELSNNTDTKSALVTQSGEYGHTNSNPSSTEIYSFLAVGNQPTGQPKKVFHQTESVSRDESSSPAYAPPPKEKTETKVTTTSYRMLSSKHSVSASSIVGLRGEEALGTETGSPEISATIPNQTGMVGKEIEGFQSKGQSVPDDLWPTTSRKEHEENKLEHSTFPTELALPPGSVEGQKNHLSWANAGTLSFPWSSVTGQHAFSRLQEGTASESRPTGLSTELGSLSYPPALQGKKEHGSEAFVTHTPPESDLLHVTQSEMKAEEKMPAHSKWSSQASTLWKMGSLAMETNQATHPKNRPHLPVTAGQRPRPLWSQLTHTKGYITVEQAPSTAMQGKESELALETPSVTVLEKSTLGQKTSLSHREKFGTGPPRGTKTYGKATLWRLISTEPFSSQMPTKPEHQPVGTQWQPLPVFFIETTIPREGKVQVQTGNPNGQGTTASLRLCGEKLPGSRSEMKSSPMEQTSKRGVSPDMGLKLGVTGGGGPEPETKESGFTLERTSSPVRKMSTTLSWVRKSSRAQERNRAGNYSDFATEESSSARMSTLPHERIQQKTRAHGQGTVPTMSVDASRVSPVLVLSKSPPNSPQSSFLSRGTESVMNPNSPSPQPLQPATKNQVASQPNEMTSSAEGRPEKPVNATEEVVLHRMNWVATLAQEGKNGASGTSFPDLGVQPTALSHVSTEGEMLLLITGSSQSPKLINHQEVSIGSHHRKDSLPSTGKALPMGTVMTFLTHLSSVINPESWESQTIPSFGSKKTTFKIQRDMAMETDVNKATPAEPYRTTSTETFLPGSHEEHIVVATAPQLYPHLQMEHLEEVSGSTSGPKVTKVLVEEKGKNFTQQSGIYFSEDTPIAIYTGIGPKSSAQNGPPMMGATNIGGRPPFPLTYSNSTRDSEEPIIIHGEKMSMPSSPGTISNLHSGASMPSHLVHRKTETIPFSLSDQHTPSAEKMESTVSLKISLEDEYSTHMKSAANVAVTPGISQVHLQNLGPTEHGIWSNFSILDVAQHQESYDHRNGEHHNLSAEPSRQAAEPQTAVKLEKVSKYDLKERKVEQSMDPSAEKLDYQHHVAKRSLLETMVSNPGYHTPRKLKLRAAFPKEHIFRKLLTVPTRITYHTLAPGLFKVPLSKPFGDQEDGVFPVENLMKESEKSLHVSTLKSKALVLLQSLSPVAKQARYEQMVNQRAMKVARSFFCSFEKDLCGWEQSKDDDLDWVLEKEEELTVTSVEDRSGSGLLCRTSGTHLSLKHSSLVPHQKAVLRSLIMPSIACLKFWYKGMDLSGGEINFYIKLLNSSEWHHVWSMKERQDISWHQITLPISKTGAVQVALEAIIGPQGRCPAGIDDLLLCQKPCRQCYHHRPKLRCDKRRQ